LSQEKKFIIESFKKINKFLLLEKEEFPKKEALNFLNYFFEHHDNVIPYMYDNPYIKLE
jgi:hypothetical protein